MSVLNGVGDSREVACKGRPRSSGAGGHLGGEPRDHRRLPRLPSGRPGVVRGRLLEAFGLRGNGCGAAFRSPSAATPRAASCGKALQEEVSKRAGWSLKKSRFGNTAHADSEGYGHNSLPEVEISAACQRDFPLPSRMVLLGRAGFLG